MCNAVFIDYRTLLKDNVLDRAFALSLRGVTSRADDVRVICLNTCSEMQEFGYDAVLSELSQTLNLKKFLFFDALHLNSWSEASGKISSWMSTHEVKAFAVVVKGEFLGDISKSYANNFICCDEFTDAPAKDVLWILSNFKTLLAHDSNVWFISDTHFSHANIIKYCNRPWNHGKDASGEIIVTPDDVKQMDSEMVKRWNSVVKADDIVWHLGDFAFGGKENAERIFPQLNGKINLVMGNHDHRKIRWYYDLGFHRVYDHKVVINDYVILTHAPLMFLNDNCPFYQVYGHIHDSPMYQTWTKNSCCACVERHDYTPVSWKKIKEMHDMMNPGENG